MDTAVGDPEPNDAVAPEAPEKQLLVVKASDVAVPKDVTSDNAVNDSVEMDEDDKETPDNMASTCLGRNLVNLATGDPRPGDSVAPEEPENQQPVVKASDVAVPEDSVKMGADDKEAPGTAEFIVQEEIVSNEEEDGARTKGQASSYFCETCQETSAETEDEHLKGLWHRKMPDRLKKYGSVENIVKVFRTCYCFICGIKSNTLAQLELHMKATKHQKRCKRFGLDPCLTNFPLGMRTPPGVDLPPGYTSPGAKGPEPAGTLPPAAKKNAPQDRKVAGVDTSTCSGKPVCDICNVTLHSDLQLAQHFAGKKHKEIVETLKAMDRSGSKGAKRPLLQGRGSGPVKRPNMDVDGAGAALGGPAVKKSYFCQICRLMLNSDFQKDEHIKGMKHKDRAKERGMRLMDAMPVAMQFPLPQEQLKKDGLLALKQAYPMNSDPYLMDSDPYLMDGDPYFMDSDPYFTNEGPFTLDRQPYPRELLLPPPKQPMQAFSTSPGAAAAVKQSFFCNVCNLVLNSTYRRDEHVWGMKHQDRALEARMSLEGAMPSPIPPTPPQGQLKQAGPLAMKRPYPTDSEPYSIDKRRLRLEGPSYPKDRLPPRAAKIPLQPSNVAAGDAAAAKPSFFCDICKLLLNSEFQRDEHINGLKHKDRATQAGLSFKDAMPRVMTHGAATTTKWPFFCNVCNLGFNSLFQQDEHVKGKKHRDRVIQAGLEDAAKPTAKLAPPPHKQLKQNGDSGMKQPVAKAAAKKQDLMESCALVGKAQQSMSYFHKLGSRPLRCCTTGDVVDRTAQVMGDRLAIVSCHQGISKTYTEYKKDIDELSAGFVSLKLSVGSKIGIVGPNLYERAVVQFAAAKAGLVLVNITTECDGPELEHCLKHVDCEAVILSEKFSSWDYYAMLLEIAPELESSNPGELKCSRLPRLKHVILIADSAKPGTVTYDELVHSADNQEAEGAETTIRKVQFDDVVNIQFTSGTTGKPKSVLLSHFNVVNNAETTGRELGFQYYDDVVCLTVPMAHPLGCIIGTLAAMTFGCTIVIPAPSFDPTATFEAIKDKKCTAVYGTPSALASLPQIQVDECKASTLRKAIVAGSSCSSEFIKSIRKNLNIGKVHAIYGSTECSPAIAISELVWSGEDWMHTVCTPIDHVEVKVVDPEGKLVPLNSKGELCVRGHPVFMGYCGDEKKTKEVVRNGWYHTGDEAVLGEDGQVTICGRIEDRICRDGEAVNWRQIEECLSTQAAVEEAQVVAVSEDICACIKLKPESTTSEEEVKDFCKGKISEAMIPKFILFVDSIPKSALGQVQRFKIRAESQEKLGL